MKIKMPRLIIVLLYFCVCGCGLSQAEETQKLPIEGQVVDYMARPVDSAEIAIINSNYYDGEHYTKVIAPFIKTNKNGRFKVQADVISQYDTYIIARKAGLAYAWDGLNYSINKKGKGIFLLVLEKANTLAGKVVDYQGNAVPGASVHAIPKTSYLSRLNQRPIFGPKEWFTTKTDANGVFSFDYFSKDVSSDFHVKTPGWNCTYKYTTHYQNACGFEVWRSDIKLVLPRESKVKGRAIEAKTGKSVKGVELLIKTGKDTEDIINRYLPVTVKTGVDGSFVSDGLPEGKHIIESPINETQVADWVSEQVEINVSLNASTDDVEVKVQKGGIIEYTVRQHDTKLLLSEVYVTTSNDNFRTSSKTNKQGITRQRMLPGEYKAYAWGGSGYDYWNSDQPLIVQEGEVTHVDIELTKSPTVSGTVLGIDGKPAKDILVTIYPHGDNIYTSTGGNFVAWYEQRWAGSGLYVMARDIPHSMAAIVHTDDFNEPSQLSLSPAMTIKGKITDPNGNGIPAARICMKVYIDAQNFVTGFGTEVLTDAVGIFELKAVPAIPDELEYWAVIRSTGFAPRTYTIHDIKEESDRIIDLGTIELQPANLSISGTVEDANGLIQPHSIIFVSGRQGVRQPDKNTATDEQGRFEMRGLCEGPLSVSANFSSDPRGRGTTAAHAGDKDIKVVLGRRLVHEYNPLHKALKDRPLPDISDLGIELKDIEGKNILLCFFDIEQRPSRRCITQLVKQAEQLKDEGVTVIVVQASKIEQEVLNQWVKKNDIPFPVGMIQGDAEEIRFSWGVRSLPWLILTDAEHIVHAVGFGIDQLDTELAKTNQPITKEEIEKHQREVAEAEIRRLGGEIIVKTSENGSEYTEVKFLGPRYQNEWKGGNLGAKYLSGLCNLRNLRIQDVETFTDEGMVYLEGLNNLKSLMLVRTQVTDNGLAHINELTNLEFLGLWSNKFTDKGLEHIIGMTNLKSLRLDDTEVTNDGLKRLKENGLLDALEFLSLIRTKISNEGLAHLTSMQNLKRLYLSDTQITSAGLDSIRDLTTLEALNLTNTDISDEGLLHIKTLTNLNMLYLRNTKITNTGLAHLGKMTDLVQLWISGTKITDTGLVYLKALNKLESLDLSHTQVTNSGLSHLEGLTSLNELFLNYSGVTIDGYLDLNEALPDCQIYWEDKKNNDSS